ncbi:MAG: hypothetical protein ACREQQ_13500, partial [Candidatus Binatia bacterium]
LGTSLSGVVDGVNRLVNSEETQLTLVAAREALVQVRDAASTLKDGIKPLTGNLKGTTKDLSVTLARLQVTLDKFNTLTDPQAPLVYRMTTTFAALDEAARAVRQLAENLNRDPSVLLTGKKGQ